MIGQPQTKASATTTGISAQRVAYEIGQLVEGEGIFAGIWEPKDRQGKSLNKKFAVFAAPEDFTDSSGKKILLTFEAAADELAKRKNWHGHDGGNYKNDTALYKALKGGSYKGEWFIPTRDLLLGTDIDGNKVHEESLFKNRNEGDFAGTYTTRESSSDFAFWYWSSSEHRDHSEGVWFGRFSDGDGGWVNKDTNRLRCRPCRVVELVI
ncbi:MAG: hypothetical protein HY053_00095 [Proteobacteria bacterium]|nr:hypothetical protein [Pseudomonadota bacterium]